MSHEHFAGRLRELRAAAGLTQAQLAVKCNLTSRAITQFEAGDKYPSWESVISIAKALSATPNDFLSKPAAASIKPRGKGRPKAS